MNHSYPLSKRVFIYLIGIWVGMMVTVGLVVPLTIFNYLTDKQVAGMIAGEIFKNASFINIFLTLILLIFANILVKRQLNEFRIIRWLLLVIILVTLIGTLVIQPWMVEIRETALIGGFPVMQSSQANMFRLLHGVSSGMFIFELILGLIVFWRSTKISTN